jgi:uncharacterized membrane protein YfcA
VVGLEAFEFWSAAVAAAILVGMSKGGLPVVGMLAVPVLSLFLSPIQAAGLLLPVYVVSDQFGLYAYRRDYDARVLKIGIPAAVIGIGIGWATAEIVPEWLVIALVGLIALVFSLVLLLRRGPEGPPREPEVGKGVFWGAMTGFTSFVSHAGAPPWQVYVLPLRLSKTRFAGTTQIMFTVVNAVKLIPYYFLGQLSVSNLEIAAALMLPAAASVFLGFWLVRILPQKLFFEVVTWALLLVGIQLLWKAWSG